MTTPSASLLRAVRERLSKPENVIKSTECGRDFSGSRCCLSCEADRSGEHGAGVYGRHTLAHWIGFALATDMQEWADNATHAEVLARLDAALAAIEKETP